MFEKRKTHHEHDLNKQRCPCFSLIKLVCLIHNIFLSLLCIIGNRVSEINKLNHCRQGVNIYFYLTFMQHFSSTIQKYVIMLDKHYYSDAVK